MRALLCSSLSLLALLVAGPLEVGPVGFDINAMVYTCLAVIVGAQLVLFGGFAEIYGWHEGIARYHHVARWTRMLRRRSGPAKRRPPSMIRYSAAAEPIA